MNMFARGFNGKQVGVSSPVQMGPVVLNMTPIGAPAQALNGPGMAPAPVQQVQQQQNAPKQAPGKGAVPMGPKANCPVCRSFGG